MQRVSWRWAAAVGLLVALCVLPLLPGLLPAHAGGRAPQALLAAVRGSQDITWSGDGETQGTVGLPAVAELRSLPDLAGGSTRTRTWWRGPTDYRVDGLSTTGETDIAVDAGGTWQWESEARRATRVVGEPAVRLPRPGDLVAPVLGRRLARAPGLVASALPARRVAGRSADGLRLVPVDPASTTVASLDLWVEPRTGLPLQVEVRARGDALPALVSRLLDVSLARPSAALTGFTPPSDARTAVVGAPDLATSIDRFAPYALPGSLAGLRRAVRVDKLDTGSAAGVGTYGAGLGVLVLLPVPRDTGARVLRALDPSGRHDSAVLQTPLLLAGVVHVVRHGWFVVAGTVPRGVVDRALAALTVAPPPRVAA